jgi:hypothetical protein
MMIGRSWTPHLRRIAVMLTAAVIWAASEARAADRFEDDGSVSEPRINATALSAAQGSLLFLAQAANVDRQRGLGIAFGGYDGAQGAAQFESAAEVGIFGAFALRGSAVYSPSTGRMRPSVGGKAQILRAGAHGVDGTVGLFYRPEGLTEPEGEVEGFISFGRAFGASYLVGNLFYGQDPEGNERDGEVRLAGLRSVGPRLLLGLDSRARFDLGTDPAKLAAHNEATFDLTAGPVASVAVGPVALMAQGGASVRRIAGATAKGAFVMAGVGTAF